MRFEEFKEVVTLLHGLYKRRSEYLDKLPNEISSFLVDNGYIDYSFQIENILYSRFFGDMKDDVDWFLFDSKSAKEGVTNCWVDGKEYCLHDLESYFDYAYKELVFDEEDKE